MDKCRPLSDDGEYLCYIDTDAAGDEVRHHTWYTPRDEELIREAAQTQDGREIIAAELRSMGYTVIPPETEHG